MIDNANEFHSAGNKITVKYKITCCTRCICSDNHHKHHQHHNSHVNQSYSLMVIVPTDLYINNLDTGPASLSIANGDPLKLTSPAQHALRR